MPSETSFHLFTSLRYDPLLLTSSENSQPWLNFVTPSPFYMLLYHRDRMLEAAQHFDFHAVAAKLEDGQALHEELAAKVAGYLKNGGKDEPLKVRKLSR
jgi:4-amino-4-deoxychorismate lyase